MVCYHLPTWLIDNACIFRAERQQPMIPSEWHHSSRYYGSSGHSAYKPSCKPCAMLQPREQCIPQRLSLPFSSHLFQIRFSPYPATKFPLQVSCLYLVCRLLLEKKK